MLRLLLELHLNSNISPVRCTRCCDDVNHFLSCNHTTPHHIARHFFSFHSSSTLSVCIYMSEEFIPASVAAVLSCSAHTLSCYAALRAGAVRCQSIRSLSLHPSRVALHCHCWEWRYVSTCARACAHEHSMLALVNVFINFYHYLIYYQPFRSFLLCFLDFILSFSFFLFCRWRFSSGCHCPCPYSCSFLCSYTT